MSKVLSFGLIKELYAVMTKEHDKFNLSGNSGLNDTLGLLICINTILPKQDFNKLIDNLTSLIDNFISNNKVITKEELLQEMHLPVNYEALKW